LFQRLAQRFLGVAQLALGGRKLLLFQLQHHVPQQGDGKRHVGVGAGLDDRAVGRAHGHVDLA
jgi:hypothetical protein